jgi:hypothetical protein
MRATSYKEMFRSNHTSKNIKLGAALLSTIASACLVTATERILLDASVNGKPAKLLFDTGSEVSAFFPAAIKRLGLVIDVAPTNDIGNDVLLGQTRELTLKLFGTTLVTRFGILSYPPYGFLHCDGMIGWWPLRDNIIEIDAIRKKLEFLGDSPARSRKWSRFVLSTNATTLELIAPAPDGGTGVFCVDTGEPRGLCLPRAKWQQWKKCHPQAPVTLELIFSPPDGAFFSEQAWADEISVGPVVLTGVPIASAGPYKERSLGAAYQGTLGLAALKRLKCIADGKSGFAYLQPASGRPPLYDHNRLAAMFGPTEGNTNQAVAVVVEGGPAYDAGVRNGDILLQVDGIDITGWSPSWLNRFHLPAGTKVRLKLQRSGRVFSTTATLREILKPTATSNANQHQDRGHPLGG